MAAYAATVTSLMRTSKRICPGLAMFAGEVDITNYNSTNAEITGITGKFKTIYAVVLNSKGENANHICRWNGTSIDCVVANTGSEVANDVDVGKFSFIAVGDK